ncbi:MAG: YfhO family protein [Oscillospiraceae bacterium]|nr:YfhO family protein [Oscillospiraceae bacterium]
METENLNIGEPTPQENTASATEAASSSENTPTLSESTGGEAAGADSASPESSAKGEKTAKKPGRFGRFFRKYGIYIAVFLLPAIVLFAAYGVFGVHPFGDQSVLVLDLNGQYVYYYENLRDALHGNGSLFNSWSRNLSGETMGMFAYYMASPFMIIPLLLPRSIMTESILILQLCKVGTAAVSFFLYLTKQRRCRRSTSFLFALMYALMAYMIVQLMNPMWLDGLIYLPFIVTGIEKLVDKGKWLAFIIPLSLMFVAHFYIGLMIAIFSCIYFLYYYFAAKKDYKLSVGSFFTCGLRFATGGIVSAFLAGWVLIPLYYSLSLGKFSFTKPDYSVKAQFDFLDFFKNLLPNVYDTCRPEGSPVIYCGVITVILLPLFFLNDRIRFREKMGLGAVLTVLLASMYLSTVDLLWHGLQVPNWLPYRYSFCFSFVLLIMGAQTFERLSGITLKELLGTAVCLLIFIFWVSRQEYDGVDLWLSTWYAAVFTAVYALVLRFVKISSRHARVILTYVLGIFITGELFGSTLSTLFAIDNDVHYSKYSSYNRYITLGRETAEMIYDADPFSESGFYRIESNYHRTVNDSLAMGTFGISHSSSTLNSAPIEFLRRMGFSYGGHYIKYKGATYITDAILGIKYITDKGDISEDKIPEDKSYDKLLLTNEDEKEIFAVYENPYALPVAFMADNSVLDVSFDLNNPFENQNTLLSHILGDEEVRYFRQVRVKDTKPENAKQSSYGAHTKYVPIEVGKNCHIEYTVKAPTSDMMYFYMPSSYERKVNLWLNKEFLDFYFEGGNMVVQTLGRFEPGEEFSFIVTVTEEKNEVLFKDKLFYYLDEQRFKEDIQKVAEHGMKVTEFKEDHLKGTINAAKDGIMFTTISWEPGWTIYVDGVKTEPVKVCDALIGVPLTAGDHDIEMRFVPEGLVTGIIFTAAGLVALFLIIMLEKMDKKADEKQKAEEAAKSV